MTREEFEGAVERHRREVVAHCYRMLGSYADAEDTAQEAFSRAWAALDGFGGNASLRTWLFRIATNACLDLLRARPRRELRIGEPGDPDADVPRALDAACWVGPIPDEAVATSESITLAFIVLLQELTPKQRAVLLARDVLGFEASEVAEQLGASVPAIEGLLHRAREVMRRRPPPSGLADPQLLSRYVAAWTSGDVAALAALLAEDATFAMPPQPAWFRGPAAIEAFLRKRVLVGGTWTLRPTRANGCSAFVVHRDGKPHAIHVIEAAKAITSITCFLDPGVVERF